MVHSSAWGPSGTSGGGCAGLTAASAADALPLAPATPLFSASADGSACEAPPIAAGSPSEDCSDVRMPSIRSPNRSALAAFL